jgi:hypothetical protein
VNISKLRLRSEKFDGDDDDSNNNNNNNNLATIKIPEVGNIKVIKFSGRELPFITVWALSQDACLEKFNFCTLNLQSITGLWQTIFAKVSQFCIIVGLAASTRSVLF